MQTARQVKTEKQAVLTNLLSCFH